MMSSEYIGGFVLGIVLVVILFAVVWKVSGQGALEGEYDERQMLIRGVGYKIAFFTCLILMAGYMLLTIFWEDLPVYPSEVMLGIIIVSVIVYALYCIRKDAFFGVKYKRKGYIIVLLVVIGSNLFGAVTRALDGSWIEPDGHIDLGFFSNSICVLGLGIVLVAILLKSVECRREELSDEES